MAAKERKSQSRVTSTPPPADRGGAAGTGKAPEAYRTVGEVAKLLGVAPHIIRYWESKFPQIRPRKGVGGRRQYRPQDVRMLRAVQMLLRVQGLTIRGAQKVLREQQAAVKSQQEASKAPASASAETVSPAPPRASNRLEAPNPVARSSPVETAPVETAPVKTAKGPDKNYLRTLQLDLSALQLLVIYLKKRLETPPVAGTPDIGQGGGTRADAGKGTRQARTNGDAPKTDSMRRATG